MILNADKNKIFIINFSQNYQFIPRFRVPDAKNDLEVVSSTKLVGITLTNDLKFHVHVQNIVKNGNNKMWMLRHLKQFLFNQNDLIEIYTIFIRSRTEYCVPAWNASLTVENKEDIERIQKTALRIILGETYENYDNALTVCKLETLEKRHEDLCLAFALKCTNHDI